MVRELSDRTVPIWLRAQLTFLRSTSRYFEKYILRKDVLPMEPLTQVYDEGGVVSAAGNEKDAKQIA